MVLKSLTFNLVSPSETLCFILQEEPLLMQTFNAFSTIHLIACTSATDISKIWTDKPAQCKETRTLLR